MDHLQIIQNLLFGFEHALSLNNLMFCARGCVVGMLVGLLPGLGPLATISLLLPLTFSLPPGGALIMLAGIYYGAQYGDNVSAITMKIPHASSIVACIDGYQMTLKGKTGVALFTAGVSSVIDGLAMCFVGVLLAQVGSDIETGVQRFTFDIVSLSDGIHLVSIALGCFGIAEITKNLDNKEQRSPFNGPIKLIPTWPEFKRIFPSALRGSIVGSALGIMPGGGPVIAQFAAYAVDKKLSKYRDEIGQGAIEGVAGQAAADEAAARTSFIPLMSLGIPENAVMALMMAAFIINGIQPGPQMIAKHPELFWGLVASMWIGNCFLLLLNVPLVRIRLSVFKIQYSSLYPAILFFWCVGTYSINNNIDDIYTTATFGVLGYIFLPFKLDPAPLILGFILGPMLEENFRRAMLISRGSFMPFATRPIAAVLITLVALFFAYPLYAFLRDNWKRAPKTAEPAGPGAPAE